MQSCANCKRKKCPMKAKTGFKMEWCNLWKGKEG